MQFFDHLTYLEERELLDDILYTIEEEYGRPVERIAALTKYVDGFRMTVIFDDFILLEAICTLKDTGDMLTVNVEGSYY